MVEAHRQLTAPDSSNHSRHTAAQAALPGNRQRAGRHARSVRVCSGHCTSPHRSRLRTVHSASCIVIGETESGLSASITAYTCCIASCNAVCALAAALAHGLYRRLALHLERECCVHVRPRKVLLLQPLMQHTNAKLLTRNATQRRRRGSPPRWIGGRRLQDVHVVPRHLIHARLVELLRSIAR